MKAHEAIARALSDNGIETLFGLIGDANLFMVDSFVRQCGGTYVSAQHEAGAVLMALGYAQASGEVGVATVTHGPAVTNTVTALIEGVKAQLPVVLLCGDTPLEARHHLQKAPQRELIMATGAGFEQLRSGKTIAEDLATALRRAVVERRPIALNMPIEIQWEEVAYTPQPFKVFDARALVPASADIDDAVGIIAAARRPVILAGRGAAAPEARAALLRLAARIGAPVATTLKAKDLFRGEPNNLGVFGTLSTPPAVDVIMQSDCLIAFGATITNLTASNGAFIDGKRVVQVNQQQGDIGRFYAPTAAMIGDPAQVADMVAGLLDEAEIAPSGFFGEEMARTLAAYSRMADGWTDTSTERTIDVIKALTVLNRHVPANRMMVTDGGRFVRQAWKIFEVDGPQSFLLSVNFGSIGLGLPEAIGASYAAPGRPTLLVTGDGGFMHGGLAEFNSAVRARRDLIVIVCNDGCYGAEHIQFRNRDLPGDISILEWPELAPLAVALGGAGVTVRTEADLDLAAEAIRDRDRPLLIDVKLDLNHVPYE